MLAKDSWHGREQICLPFFPLLMPFQGFWKELDSERAMAGRVESLDEICVKDVSICVDKHLVLGVSGFQLSKTHSFNFPTYLYIFKVYFIFFILWVKWAFLEAGFLYWIGQMWFPYFPQ